MYVSKARIDKLGQTHSVDEKIIEEQSLFKVKCHCGHKTVIYPMEHIDKKICSWCGHYVYKDKKTEFMEKLKLEGVYQ